MSSTTTGRAAPASHPSRRFAAACVIAFLSSIAMQASAQTNGAGRTASIGIGTVGQRQERNQIVPGVKPIDRISGRIENRVQSRLRNRIDRFYDPQANAIAPFAVASEQARTTSAAPHP